MVKIVKKTENDITTYQVVDEVYGDIPENRGKPASTVLEAVNLWLYPNNDESAVAKFMAEVPVVEERMHGDLAEHMHGGFDYWHPVEKVHEEESLVGEIPHGNIINMIMGREVNRPNTHHALIHWCMSVLGYESITDSSIPCVGYDMLNEVFLSQLNSRVQKIDNPMLLLKLIEVSKEGIRGCRGDKYNDAVAEAIQNACMVRLGDFMDSLPPSLWHKVHRHELWLQGAETEMVSLPSPDGWVTFSGFRESQHGGWKMKMQVPKYNWILESPQYVVGMGMKARHDGYAKGSHSGVVCEAFHLFNADGSLWGFEVYLTSPKKTVGCEVTKDGRFSLFRKEVIMPPRSDIRQGDMLLRRIEVQAEDEITSTPIGYTPGGMESVTVQHSQAGEPHSFVNLTAGIREHRHEGYDYWHPVVRIHSEVSSLVIRGEETRLNEYKQEYENVLVLKDDAVLTHPDHLSISLRAGYWQILPVEGETDYQPRQRGGD